MYDELLKRLRDAAKMSEALAVLLPHSEGSATAKLFNEAADAIEELSKPRWIPVTERLPEDREMVIGYTPCDGFMFVGYHVTSIYHDRDFSYWNIVTAMRSTRKMMKKVTHWMPLPEPPKEEAE